jgi:phenylacetate-coenzyme A ligase PaaK-like adenylate-forming protein
MTNWFDKVPVFVQNWLISLYGQYWKKRRYGGVFKEQLIQFKKRETFTKEQWHNYQTTELRKLLVHAYTTVPYYTKVYSEHGFKLSDFKNFKLDQLKSLPILEKEVLRKLGTSDLLSTKRDRGVFYASSGSTGTPVQIYFSKKFHQTQSALYETRVRNWAGLDCNDSRGMIGGRRFIKSAKNKAPFYRYNKAEKQTYFSAYHISAVNAQNYLEGIKSNKVEYMVGYAMSNYLLADLFDSLNLKAPKLKAVITSSEKLTPRMREIFSRVYQCKTFDSYSAVEACGLISENKFGEKLFSPDSGIMEVVDNVSKPVSNGETGEIIATGLLNFDQPLIRYRIGDSVKISQNQKSRLNMLKIDEIEGRVEDVIIGKQGQKMVRFHGLFVDIPFLKLAQVIQHTTDNIEIKLVVTSNFSKKEENIIYDRMTSQLGQVNIQFDYVSEILNNKNGKYQAVISKIKKKDVL